MLDGRKNVGVVVKVKNSKVFEVGGVTFAIFRLLRIDYQQLTSGETTLEKTLYYSMGFTFLYYLIFN